jgi:type II secretion system protein N
MNKRFLYSLWTLASLLLFLWLLFPGEFAESLIEGHADRRLGAGSVDVEGVRPALLLGLSVQGLALTLPDLPVVTAQDIRLTPSWLTLFTLRPGAAMKASLFGGNAEADARIRYSGLAWDRITGEIEDVDLATLSPFVDGRLPVDLVFSGRGQANLELTRDKGVKGKGRIELADVTVGITDPIIPVEKLSFASVVVEVEVTGRTLTVGRIHVDGTEVDAELRGTLTLSNPLESSRVNLTGTVNPDPGFVKELTDRAPLAMLMDPKLLKKGRIPLRISGTLGDPKVSFK